MISISIFVCSIKEPFGAVQTPRILDDSEGGGVLFYVVPRESE